MPTPTRRRLLAATGAVVVAGCLDTADPDGGPSGSSPDGTTARSSPPGESTPDSCPAYGDDRVVCYDGIDPDEVDVVLEPDRRTVADGESIAFTLENATDETLNSNFYDWRVHKYVDGAWYHVAPRGIPEPMHALPPGESQTWTRTLERDGLEDGESTFSTGVDDEIQGVGPGTYAFRVRGWFADDSHEEALAFAATFEVEGDRLELSPSDAIAATEWDEGVLVAESTRGDPDDERHRPGAFDLERVDGATEDDPESLITEQLLRRPRLRDAVALSLEHDADRVRLEEYDATHPVFGSRSDGVVEYQGTQYRIETRELEE